MSDIVTIINGTIEEARTGFAAALSDRSINFDREAKFAIQLLTANDYIMKIARSNPQSVINAVTNIAAIGISLNPAKRQAYLVPRDGKICLDISYMGLMDLAIDSGSLMWAQAAEVRESDAFVFNGLDKAPTHTFNPFGKDRGEVVGYYVVTKTAAGDYLTTTMSIDAVNAIRDRSVAWRAWMKDQKSCPWVTDPAEMGKKTVVRLAYKYWPKTDRLRDAVHYMNTDGDEGVVDVTPAPKRLDPTERIALANQAKTVKELTDIWTDHVHEFATDKIAYAKFKEAVSVRGKALKEAEAGTDGGQQ